MTIQLELQQALLILIRITSFIVVAPGLSFKGMPNLAKVALSAGIAIAAYPLIPMMTGEAQIMTFLILGVKEVLMGMALGYIAKLFFAAVEMAGNMVDFQVGFSMGQAFDPSLGVNASFYGRVYYWLSICLFFLTDLHHSVIRSLVLSFQYVPIESTDIGNFGTEGILKLFTMVFELAFNLAAPLIIVSLLTEVVLGLISRTVPQINVLILGMPMKIIVSFLLMLVLLPTLAGNIGDVLPKMVKYMNEFVRSLPAG